MNIKKTTIKLFTKVFSVKIMRYLFNGGLLFLMDFLFFYSLTKVFNVDIRISQAISRTISASIGFFTHKFFVFKNTKKKIITFSSQGTAYIILLILNIFLSAELVYFLAKIAKMDNLLIIKIITETIMVIETYTILNIIFHKKKNVKS